MCCMSLAEMQQLLIVSGLHLKIVNCLLKQMYQKGIFIIQPDRRISIKDMWPNCWNDGRCCMSLAEMQQLSIVVGLHLKIVNC